MELRELPASRFTIKKGAKTETKEWVVTEEKYQIIINRTGVASVSASPCMIKELAVGYLVGGGFLQMDDITHIEVRGNAVNVVSTKEVDAISKYIRSSDCSSQWISETIEKEGTVKSSLRVPAKVIAKAVSRLQSDTETWKKTHAVHSAGMFTENGTLIGIVEDISRHSAFDKVIGRALLDNCDFSSVFVAVSGRITKDMVIKAAHLGIAVIASRSTVIEPAVTVASALEMTIIGYVRGDHLVVFSHPERITAGE